MKRRLVYVGLAFAASVFSAFVTADPLPSWNDTASKEAVIAFVEKVTNSGSPDFVPAGERIATFDNDGALWAKQPSYFQVQRASPTQSRLEPGWQVMPYLDQGPIAETSTTRTS